MEHEVWLLHVKRICQYLGIICTSAISDVVHWHRIICGITNTNTIEALKGSVYVRTNKLWYEEFNINCHINKRICISSFSTICKRHGPKHTNEIKALRLREIRDENRAVHHFPVHYPFIGIESTLATWKIKELIWYSPFSLLEEPIHLCKHKVLVTEYSIVAVFDKFSTISFLLILPLLISML